MGKYLDECCKDAWDVIRGRKKIVGNRIIEVSSVEDIEDKKEEIEYGWLSPDGIFYPVEFAKHQAWASSYVLKLCKNGDISFDEAPRSDAGDWLVDRGWVLIHNPYHTLKITMNPVGRLTKRQKDFLYAYLSSRGKIDEANKILDDEI